MSDTLDGLVSEAQRAASPHCRIRGSQQRFDTWEWCVPPVTGLYCDFYDHSSVLAAPLQVANVEEEQVRSAKKQMQRGGRGDSVGPEGGAGGEAEERRDSQGKTSPKKQQWAMVLPGKMDLVGAGGGGGAGIN